jgi:senataxin
VLIASDRKLLALPADTHWFCPQDQPEDDRLFFEEDRFTPAGSAQVLADDVREDRLKKFKVQKGWFYQAIQIFSFNRSDSTDMLRSAFESGISNWLKACPVCVREYHALRQNLQNTLEIDYETDRVQAFMDIFDDFNNQRITNNLDHAHNQLLRLPEDQRNIRDLDETASFAFLEALASPVLSRNERLLVDHFDKPFQLMKGVGKLRLSWFLPASSSFLYVSDDARREWAQRCWAKLQRSPTSREFNWCMRDNLAIAISRVRMDNFELHFLPTFWKAMTTMLTHMNEDSITNSLSGLEDNVWILSLDHLHQRSPAFLNIISGLALVLRKAPAVFWNSMSTITPPTVVEQIFNSPNFMPAVQSIEESDLTQLQDLARWVDPFVDSISMANQPRACRSLVQHFIELWNNRSLPTLLRESFFEYALATINTSLGLLIGCSQKYLTVDAACIGEALSIFHTYAPQILARAKQTRTLQEDIPLALQNVQKAIELDTLLINSAFLILQAGAKDFSPHHFAKSGLIWETLAKSIQIGDIALTSQVLIGGKRLALVERMFNKTGQPLVKRPQLMNNAMDKTYGFAGQILDRLNDFPTRDIESLFKTAESASGIVTALFYSDADARISAMDVLKTLSGEDGRRDALRHVMSSAYFPFISSLAQAVRAVQSRKLYIPLSAVVLVCSDAIDALCSSQDGLLREKDLNDEEAAATRNLWETLWQTIFTIFDNTERWSKIGYDKNKMMEFCRDVMQFADELFDHHSVFVSALCDLDAEDLQRATITEQFLKHPNLAMVAMVKWLRLRDDYLVSRGVNLISGILDKLNDASLEATVETTSFLADTFDGTVKSKLTPTQIASLQKSLEKHTGIEYAQVQSTMNKAPRQSSINSWLQQDGPTAPLKRPSKNVIDLDKWRNAASAPSSDSDRASSSSLASQRRQPQGQDALKSLIPKRNLPPGMKKPAPKVPNADFMRQRAADLEAQRKAKAALIEKTKRLRSELIDGGSGLQGLRTLGKDHTRGSGMMVSSESEEESDDEEADPDLFPGRHARQKPVSAAAATKKIPTVQGPLKVKRLVRSAKDMRARLAPDLTPLHKIILSWDYYAATEYPPGSNPQMYKAVPTTFNNIREYKDVFQPLLILEAWQGFVKAREESNFKSYEIKVQNRATVDAFVEFSTSWKPNENKDGQVSEGDIVLWSLNQTPDPDQPHCLARVHKVARKAKVLEVVYRILPTQTPFRNFGADSMVWGIKVQSLTPLEREYGALQSLEYYDLADWILHAKPSPLLEYKDHQVDGIVANYALNRAQAKAVKSAVDNDAFTLIQG